MGGFELMGSLGKGGMGQVFLARQLRPAREVALKIIHPHLANDDVRARFVREADALGRLSHPNIVSVYAFGEDDDKLYMAMERVEGTTLRGLLDAEGPLSPTRAAELARQMVNALAHAHSRQVIHRDLKPGNVLVTVVDGVETIKIVDFGLARFLDSHVQVTRTGRLVGSAPYMSPEQWDEKPDLSGAIDVYAFGIVLFEMLTGQLPFRATSPAGFMRAHLTSDPLNPVATRPELAECPGLVGMIRRCMSRDSVSRPSTAELRDELGGSQPSIDLDSLPAPTGWSDSDVETEDSEPPWQRPDGTAATPAPALATAAEATADWTPPAANPEVLPPTPAPQPAPELETTGPDATIPPDAQPPRIAAWLALAAAVIVTIALVVIGGDEPAPEQPIGMVSAAALGSTPPAPAAPTVRAQQPAKAEPMIAPKTVPIAQPDKPPDPVRAAEPTSVELVIEASPRSATLWVAGRAIGRTPQTVVVPKAGQIAIELKRPRYQTIRQTIDFQAASAADAGTLVIAMHRAKKRPLKPQADKPKTSGGKTKTGTKPATLKIDKLPIR